MSYGSAKEEHAFKVFNRDLKEGNFPSVLLLFGEEDYLISWAIDSLARKFTESESVDFDLQKLEGDSTSVADILEICDTFSMFSEKKVVVVRDFPLFKNQNAKGFTEKDKDELVAYLENPNESSLLIFASSEINENGAFTKQVMKLAGSYNFKKLDLPDLKAFIEKRFKANKVEISRPMIQLLIDETGYLHKDSSYRIFNLENDIKKIVAVGDGQSVAEHDIISTLHGDLDTFAFDFINAVSTNRKAQAFELLENILAEGNDVFSLLGLLISNFELLLEVSEFSKERGLNQIQIAKQLKVHEFRVKNALSASSKMDISKIKSTLSQLYEIDRNVKTGDLEQKMALELLVAGI